MKKFIMLFIGMCFLIGSGNVFAAAVPTVSGQDVIVPVALIATISDSPSTATVVAIMHDAKGAGHKVPMTFNGTDFIAPGAKGADFHPAIMDGNKPNFAKIEEVWDTNASFIHWRRGGPCLNVK